MSKVIVINIGNELTSGIVVNSGGATLCKRLVEEGHDVPAIHVVGDHLQELDSVLSLSLENADAAILTGGLGPTEDDRTRFFLADLCNAPLFHNSEAGQRLRDFFHKRHMKFRDVNLVQARLPEGARILPNPLGTACGFSLKWKGKTLFALPGVPREMRKIFENSVLPLLNNPLPGEVRELLSFGLGESRQEELLKGLVLPANTELASLPAAAGLRLRLRTSGANSQAVADATLEEILCRFEKNKDDLVSTCGESLAEVLVKILAQRKENLSLAESCTGGMVSAALTDVPGSSAVFPGAVVSYSNSWKERFLNVPPETLENFGTVSRECVRAMAEGNRLQSRCTWSGAISGIAGPEGGSRKKPVGLVWFAISGAKNTKTWWKIFIGSRREIRERAGFFLLDLLRRQVSGYPLPTSNVYPGENGPKNSSENHPKNTAHKVT